jgi:glycosyltransferase involved in cell wall biosynthesis
VTPCRNAAERIAVTVRSVLEQTAVLSGRVALQYLVRDGASTDGTEQVVRDVAGGRAVVRSEPDRSMYEALANGLANATGELIAYINAGDILFPRALDTALDVMEQASSQWLTGYPVTVNDGGQVTWVSRHFRYDPRLIRIGSYGRQGLPFIQQESTLWKRQLLTAVDLDRLAGYRLAGDHYLWSCFAQHVDLDAVNTLIGAFRVHTGQLSSDLNGYWSEVARHRTRPTLADRAILAREVALWRTPGRVRDAWVRRRPISYDHDIGRWVR